jgi:CheY-like chemotaxis protein
MDMQMPGTDGLSLTRMVKADPALAGVSVVLMTSLGAIDRAAAQASGLDGWLTKPVRQSVLFDAVMRAFAKDTAAGAAPAEAAAAGARLPGRILVVEDVSINRIIATHQLRKIGYESDAVANGLEALRALKAKPYDLILMDSHMPEMDGFETSARIRAMSDKLRDIPIVAMTADALTGDREKCLSAGMNDYVTKPVDIAELDKVLKRWLQSRPASKGQA